MGGKRKKHYDKSVYRSFTLITQFGINMLVPICLMTALGIYLDKRFDTAFLMILFFFMGALAGGQNVFRLAKKIYNTSDNKNRYGSRRESEQHSGEATGNIKAEK